MTQVFYRANLRDEQFPFVSEFQGRTIIQPSIDQNYIPPETTAAIAAKDRGIPEAYYMHNVVPSLHGYKSVAYTTDIPAIPGVNDVSRVFPVKDFDGNRGHIAVTKSGKTYLLTNLVRSWVDVTQPGQPPASFATVASATGSSFICYSNWGIYTINIVAGTLTPTTLQWDSPTTNADIVGISTSNNYLLAHTANTLFWSSSLDVLDFRASQITGAGNGTPASAIGAIITLAVVGVGFAIYCQGNIIVATFSGNVQYPWIFKEAPNGSGVISSDHVSLAGDASSSYAWTSAGLLQVGLSGCEAIFPEATDFLGSRIFEDFDNATNVFNTVYLSVALKVRIAFLASRYLVLSYGVQDLTHALIYDKSLRRWGKLKIEHCQIIDLAFESSTSNVLLYNDLGIHIYNDYRLASYLAMQVESNPQAAEPKHTMAAVELDGTIKRINFEFGNNSAEGVLLLGKYQIFRASTVAINNFYLETIESDNNDFSVQVLTSYDGKNIAVTKDPYETIQNNMRSYSTLSVGQNHSFLIKGAFHLVSALLVFYQHANR